MFFAYNLHAINFYFTFFHQLKNEMYNYFYFNDIPLPGWIHVVCLLMLCIQFHNLRMRSSHLCSCRPIFNQKPIIKQEAQLPQRNSASAAHTCAADALFFCGSCIGIGTWRSWNAQNTAESPRLYYFWHSNALIQEVLAFCHEIATQGHSFCIHLPVDKW